MSQPSDEQVETIVADFLREALDGQQGRSEARFRRYLDSTMKQKWKQRAWLIGAFASGMAASVAALWAAPLFTFAPPVRQEVVQSNGPATEVPSNLLTPVMERVADSQTLDEGVMVLDDDTPVRVVRRRAIERTRWFDEHQEVRAQQITPKDDLMFIKLTTY